MHGEKNEFFFSFESNNRKQCLCYLLYYKMVETRFLISKKVFHWFLSNYTEFVHETFIQPSKYDSTSGPKISICLKKWGMRLWIGTSTFNVSVFLFVCLLVGWFLLCLFVRLLGFLFCVLLLLYFVVVVFYVCLFDLFLFCFVFNGGSLSL